MVRSEGEGGDGVTHLALHPQVAGATGGDVAGFSIEGGVRAVTWRFPKLGWFAGGDGLRL